MKPCINQVDVSTCCVIPQDLQDFAKQNDIQLMTHSDPAGKLPLHYTTADQTMAEGIKWRKP